MSYREYIEKHPEMSVAQLTKKLKCGKSTVSTTRYQINKKQRPRKVKPSLNGDTLSNDIKLIKKMGLERAKLICQLLQS